MPNPCGMKRNWEIVIKDKRHGKIMIIRERCVFSDLALFSAPSAPVLRGSGISPCLKVYLYPPIRALCFIGVNYSIKA